MSTSSKPYHHGDLRATLLAAAIESLEAGEPFSLRAVARRAGVSPTAPYRHFADREALDSAVAIEGFRDLRADLQAALAGLKGSAELAGSDESAAPEDVITALGVAYVGFALRRPAVFRLMFGNECDEEDSERVHASEQLHHMLNQAIGSLFPDANNSNLSIALWSVAHGLAFLHLDGKLRPQTSDDVAARVKSAVGALFALNNNKSGG
ncbi:TetR/AcrR family transcriptional regulator [Paenarthrobacter aurescens]|uniref:TetR family transcriptional regulator n=1 Tax=Paenarthrobacter aurescens TaxID=43663 RepID=A0A4Y3NAN7_PAEAU|nr:TetR/AcrR family transcriptional regulator [Paenarthrobacter aurescens]MDO6144895.1 TetR/AcrR family transcriptional regulator [Paenarthrobacter aurescens]MDO6148740.1 TetR/AcrR family transcriptional regulator [Paenarthrobacter aurescens]MDO6159986.1 TetR/AcrR family transcriptional regulator [Paenarthrobacter aurescens]MDO6163845.1 TetR/AcrR family transcriptional regulator [Paenarthrobacter aurescens]GEB17445.1 TetR family transcriptional regulator [Paenarthrobacter aurescens]